MSRPHTIASTTAHKLPRPAAAHSIVPLSPPPPSMTSPIQQHRPNNLKKQRSPNELPPSTEKPPKAITRVVGPRGKKNARVIELGDSPIVQPKTARRAPDQKPPSSRRQIFQPEDRTNEKGVVDLTCSQPDDFIDLRDDNPMVFFTRPPVDTWLDDDDSQAFRDLFPAFLTRAES